MSKVRHIALSVPDPEEAAQFFERAFDMVRVGTARRGIYVSDGTFNVALLRTEPGETVGPLHFGVWVDDFEAAQTQIEGAGGRCIKGMPESPNSYYEAKFAMPNGIVFDVTHSGWAGAVKDVRPVETTESHA
jgi:methylmalonyl-CoA/ethylmalonyl-CoA epimerase